MGWKFNLSGSVLRCWVAWVGMICLAALCLPANAQIGTLDKGHRLLVSDGLQIWGADTDTSYTFNYSTMAGANLTGVLWGFPAANGGSDMSTLATGDKWSREEPYTTNPDTVLTTAENSHKSDLLAIQVGDEQQFNSTSDPDYTTTLSWFQTAQAHNDFPNQLLYINQNGLGAAYPNFIAAANPDSLSFDAYPFSNPDGQYITSYNWLGLAQTVRRYALGTYIGATSTAPRPYGAFLQTYHDSFAVDPGDVEMRWQQFTLLTMGYTFMDAFIYDGGNTNFYTQGTLYNQFKATANLARHLGPELVKLISYSNGTAGGGTSIVLGKNSSGVTNPVPNSWQVFNKTDAPANQRYLTSVSVKSLSSKNGSDPSNPGHGYAGDVYVGFFNPLQTSYGDPAGEAYFMVTNGLGGSLTLSNGQSDNQSLVTDCQQQITLNFDFQSSGIDALEGINLTTGQDQLLPLVFDGSSSGHSLYHYTFTEDGGTGDLFKFADGEPFVGAPNQVPEPGMLGLGVLGFLLFRRRRFA